MRCRKLSGSVDEQVEVLHRPKIRGDADPTYLAAGWWRQVSNLLEVWQAS